MKKRNCPVCEREMNAMDFCELSFSGPIRCEDLILTDCDCIDVCYACWDDIFMYRLSDAIQKAFPKQWEEAEHRYLLKNWRHYQ